MKATCQAEQLPSGICTACSALLDLCCLICAAYICTAQTAVLEHDVKANELGPTSASSAQQGRLVLGSGHVHLLNFVQAD